jgi:hypothetical protein
MQTEIERTIFQIEAGLFLVLFIIACVCEYRNLKAQGKVFGLKDFLFTLNGTPLLTLKHAPKWAIIIWIVLAILIPIFVVGAWK